MAPFTLDQFLVRRQPLEADAAVHHIQEAGKLHSTRKKLKRCRKGSDWSTWAEETKRQCCATVASHGYKYLQNVYADKCPPASTVRTWRRTLQEKGVLRLPGRPKWLTDTEEANLYRAVVALRRHGCIVDSETLVVMALATVNLSGAADRLLPLTVHWSKAFRQRWKLGRMRKPSTDRPPLTAANWEPWTAGEAVVALCLLPSDFATHYTDFLGNKGAGLDKKIGREEEA